MLRTTLACFVVLAAGSSAACSANDASGTSPLTRSDTESSTASAAPVSRSAQQALAAYEAMWSDVRVLSEASNYTDPRLGDHLDGQAYMTISENMSVNKAYGIVGRGTPVLHPRVLTANPTAVTLADCMDDTNWLEVYAKTGELVDSVPGGHRYTTATVTDENGTWKVTAIDTRGDGSCA